MVLTAREATAINTKALKSLIGKLNDVSYIIPEGLFFLNRL